MEGSIFFALDDNKSMCILAGMKLRIWRQNNEITLVNLALQLGISTASLSRIERGQQWPDKETMQAIVKVTKGAVKADSFLD